MEKGLGVPVEDLTERERQCQGCRAGGTERQPDGGAQTLAIAEVDLQLEHAAERSVVAARGCRAMAPGCGVGTPTSREVREAAERRCGEGGGSVGDVELWPGVRRVRRRRRERSGRRREATERRCGEGGGGVGGGCPGVRRGSLTTSGGRRERPTICHPSTPAYIPMAICRGGS